MTHRRTCVRDLESADVEPLANREHLDATAPRFPRNDPRLRSSPGAAAAPSTLPADSLDQELPIPAQANAGSEATTLPVYSPLNALDDPINGGCSSHSRHGRADSNFPSAGSCLARNEHA